METQKRNFPNHFERFEPQAAAAPQATLPVRAGEELLLVSGGPGQLLERCPKWGCIAWYSDRAGKVLHAWEVDLEELWSGLSGIAGDVNRLSLYPVGMILGEDRSLVVSFQGRETHPGTSHRQARPRRAHLWKRFDRSHHWPTVDAAGRIYTPASTAVRDMKHVGTSRVEVKCATGEGFADSIRVLSPEGQPLRELPLIDAFVKSDYAGLFTASATAATRRTSIPSRSLPRSGEGHPRRRRRRLTGFAARDQRGGAARRRDRGGQVSGVGRSAAQHAAQFLPDGSVLALDNFGGERSLGGPRVVASTSWPAARRPCSPRTARRACCRCSPTPRARSTSARTASARWSRYPPGPHRRDRRGERRAALGLRDTHDIGPFLKQAAIRSDTTRARFATYGAYYVQGDLK